MMKRLVLLAALCGASVHAQTITNPDAFAKAIAEVKKGSVPADKFAEPVALPIAGQSFKLTLPAKDGVEGEGSVVYDYKDGELILDVTPVNLWPMLKRPGDGFPALKLSSSTKSLGEYTGQNAYGATARVRNFSNTGSAIALISAPKPMLSPMKVRIGATNLEDSDWWIKLTLPPSEAKTVALDTVGVIEGTYTNLPDGSAGACSFSGVSATIDRPSNYSSETCYIGANVTRIALVRKSSGEVLKEWTLSNSPRLGPVLWGKVQVGMSQKELSAAYPSATSWGAIEDENAQVYNEKGVASYVRVMNWGASGKTLVKLLTTKYGKPEAYECYSSTSCRGKWNVSDEVSAYLVTGDVVEYRLSSAKSPIGF